MKLVVLIFLTLSHSFIPIQLTNAFTFDMSNLTPTQGFYIKDPVASTAFASDADYAGDFNGDGFTDYIAGASGTVDGTSNSKFGGAYLMFGKVGNPTSYSLSAFSIAKGIAIFGSSTTPNAGISVGYVGDVNADGVDDVAIGVPYESANGLLNSGAVYVIFGGKGRNTNVYLNLFNNNMGFKVLGSRTNLKLGKSVKAAGDVNGDGIADLIIGTFGSCTAFLVFGRRTNVVDVDLASLTSNLGIKISSANTATCGSSVIVNAAGDANGDGVDDFMIGSCADSYGARDYAGSVTIIYGSRTGLTDMTLGSLTPTQGYVIYGARDNDHTGHFSIGVAGDVNGDGVQDFILGAPYAFSSTGSVYVVYGVKGGGTNIDMLTLTSSQGMVINGNSPSDNLGLGACGMGDLNGDGYAEIAVGAPYTSVGGRTKNGAMYIIYGGKSLPLSISVGSLTDAQGAIFMGANSNDQFGYYIRKVGDINADGETEVAVTALAATSIMYVLTPLKLPRNTAMNQTTTTPTTNTSTVVTTSTSTCTSCCGDSKSYLSWYITASVFWLVLFIVLAIAIAWLWIKNRELRNKVNDLSGNKEKIKYTPLSQAQNKDAASPDKNLNTTDAAIINVSTARENGPVPLFATQEERFGKAPREINA